MIRCWYEFLELHRKNNFSSNFLKDWNKLREDKFIIFSLFMFERKIIYNILSFCQMKEILFWKISLELEIPH